MTWRQLKEQLWALPDDERRRIIVLAIIKLGKKKEVDNGEECKGKS